jgi:AraC-like DNA-binding protein
MRLPQKKRRLLFEPIQAAAGSSFFHNDHAGPHFGFHWHQHPEIEIAVVTRGRGRRYVGDSIADFAAGDLVLIGSDVPHTWHSDPADGPVASGVIQFLPAVFGGVLDGTPELRAIAALLRRADRGLAVTGATRARVVALFQRIRAGSGWRQVSDLIELLGTISDAAPGDVQELSNAVPRAADERAHRTIDRVFAELHGPPDAIPTQAAMARALKLSPAAFSRFFRRAVGKTYVACVNEIRVLAACRELIETERPVIDVAYAAGFGNLSNFNRRFRALKGMTPREFRRQCGPPQRAAVRATRSASPGGGGGTSQSRRALPGA